MHRTMINFIGATCHCLRRNVVVAGIPLLLLALIFGLQGCQKEAPVNTPDSDLQARFVDLLQAGGLDPSNFELWEGNVLKGGDIYLEFSDFEQRIMNSLKPTTDPEELEQRHRFVSFNSTVGINNAQNIAIWVHPSMVGVNVLGNPADQAVNQAIAEWNGINGSALFLQRVGAANQADIVIFMDNANPADVNLNGAPNVFFGLPFGTCGVASLPNGNGDPYRWISINDNPPHGIWNQFVRTVIHEIGHTIGFDHTNENGSTMFPCSPTNNSLMDGGECGTGLAALSADDERVIRYTYPDPLPTPNLINAWRVHKTLHFQVDNPSNTILPYKVIVNVERCTGCTYDYTYTFTCTSGGGWTFNGDGTFKKGHPLPATRARVRFSNYAGDRLSNWSNWDSVGF